MPIAHKLALLCIAALAALAFGATSASAQGVTVENEQTGAPCNPCVFEVEGESEFHTTTGIPITVCQDDLEAEIYSQPTGEMETSPIPPTEQTHWGHVDDYVNADHDLVPPGCIREGCRNPNQADEHEWPISNVTEVGNETAQMVIRFCLAAKNPGGAPGAHCNETVNIAEDHVNHHHILTTASTCTGLGVRVQGAWEIDPPAGNHSEIEFIHAN